MRPGFFECHPINLLEKIYPRRRLADLEGTPVREVMRAEALKESAILCECAEYCFAVVCVGANEDVQIFGGSWFGVDTDAYPPTIRYLTCCSLNASKRSLRSLGSIGSCSPEGYCKRICRFAEIPDGRESLADRTRMPILDGFAALLFWVLDSTDCSRLPHEACVPDLNRYYISWS